jgi:hypothetical protein
MGKWMRGLTKMTVSQLLKLRDDVDAELKRRQRETIGRKPIAQRRATSVRPSRINRAG